MRDLGLLDRAAIAGVREDAWPEVRNADEMHEALMQLGAITAAKQRFPLDAVAGEC